MTALLLSISLILFKLIFIVPPKTLFNKPSDELEYLTKLSATLSISDCCFLIYQ